MPIAALSVNAVRAIGSSQVLTDPPSVVKELVDNALDAWATSISVEISTNSLDVIQVRDNGCGIGPEDRAMVGRRYCTSKIRDLDDLRNVGGQSLGFRGEALASAAELSDGVVVTTRVEGEAVAVSLRIDRNGETESQDKTSHPVGTTVRVANFLNLFPVRKQTALKNSAKSLAKIKQTLQAYAIARPSTRLSFKVLKAKNEKGNWVYAPKAGASVADAAMKVVDKTSAGQCHWVTWCSPEFDPSQTDAVTDIEESGAGHLVKSSYKIEAFLPRPAADVLAINHAGHFVSIDSRNHIRMTYPKHTEKIINPFLCLNIVCPSGSYDANVEPAKDDVLFVDQSQLLSLLEAFFTSVYGEVQVEGERGSRSTNLPHGSRVKEKGFELLLTKKQPAARSSASPNDDKPTTHINAEDTNNSHRNSTRPAIDGDGWAGQDELYNEAIHLQIGRATPSCPKKVDHTPKDLPSSETSLGNQDAEDGEPSFNRRSSWHFNMYDDDDESTELLDDMPTGLMEDGMNEEEGLGDVTVTNPWTIAKMNTFVRPDRRAGLDDATEDVVGNGQLMTPAREGIGHRLSTNASGSDLIQRTERHNAQNLPTPQRTLRSSSLGPDPVSSPYAWQFPSKAWGKRRSRDEKGGKRDPASQKDGSSALDTWVEKLPSAARPALGNIDTQLSRKLSEENRTGALVARQQRPAQTNDFISALSLQQGTRLSDIPEAPLKRPPRQTPRNQYQEKALHRPFVSPVNDPHKVWFETEPQRRAKPLPQARTKNARDANTATPIRFESEDEGTLESINPVTATTTAGEPTALSLEKLMDYEHRKRAATQEYRASLLQQANRTPSRPNHGQVEQPRICSTNSPHKNRYEAAKAALSPSKDEIAQPAPIFADGDPRAYLIRVQKREEAAWPKSVDTAAPNHRLRRARTTMLPFETIAADRGVHNLVFTIPTDVPSVKKYESEAMRTDDYVRSGVIGCGLLASIDNIRAWEQRVSTLIKQTYRRDENREAAQIPFEIWPVLQEHLRTHS